MGNIAVADKKGKKMCVAIPGLVKKYKDGKVTVDFNGNEVEAYAGLVNVKEGDYALVHAGCVIQTLKKNEAEELLELMGDLEGPSYSSPISVDLTGEVS